MAEGKLAFLTIGSTTDTDDGPDTTIIGLEALRQHCRRERVDDLMDDLQMLCEDVQAAGRPSLTLLRRIR